MPVRTVRALGAELIVLTNAAGSLRAEVGPGRLMALTDHINMTGRNPLVGPTTTPEPSSAWATAYDPELLDRLHAAAAKAGVELAEGVYLAVPGPSFETAAEIRAFRILGADAVGMSTVLETIAARHCGLRVAAVSAITNLAEGMSAEVLSHEGTLARGRPGRERPRPRAPTLRGGPRMIDPVAVIDLTTLEDDDTRRHGPRAVREGADTRAGRSPRSASCPASPPSPSRRSQGTP